MLSPHQIPIARGAHASNIAKHGGSPHGIAFEDAIRIFEGSTVERVDDRFDYGERRVYAIGLVNGLEITLIYTDRESEERRIISAWRAEPHERRRYWKNVEG